MKTKWNLGRLLLSGASVAAMGAMASPALAQEEVSEEIVVTATGRAAAIQDVPIAVQALGAETIEQAGVDSLTDLNQLTPSMRIGSGQSTTAGTIASIRGIGTGADNPGFESAVGFFIDGVYRARAGAALSDLPEVQRIEVLRGPQGTLFGKNTSAGAIHVITAGPDHDFGVWGELGVGDRNELRSSFGMTGALAENFAVRFDGAIRAQDGYITATRGHIGAGGERDVNDTNRWSMRGQALWDLTPNASLRLIVDASETDENCCAAVNIQTGAVVNPIANGFFPGSLLGISPENRRMTLSPARSYGEAAEDFGASAELNWDIGDMTLTSVTAYRDWSAERDQDIDFTSFDRAYRDGLEIGFETFSQELRLQGESGRINWLVGAFMSNEQLETTDRIRFGSDAVTVTNAASAVITTLLGTPGAPYRVHATATPGTGAVCILQLFGGTCLPNIASGDGQVADNWNVETQTWSLFTHNEVSLSDNLIWTIGLRYNNETKDMTANLNAVNPACDSLRGANQAAGNLAQANGAGVLMALACNAVTNTLANGNWADDRDEEEFSGTTALSFHVNDDLMIYGSYSRGYKAGGFNVDRSAFFGPGNLTPMYSGLLSTASLQFEPEFTDAFELGFKSTVFGGTTTFNTTLFHQTVSDYQLNAFSGINFFTRNVEEVISQGAELELVARPTDNLTLTGGVLYVDATYESNTTLGADVITAGTPLSNVPEFTVTGSLGYTLPVGDTHAASFYLNGRYVTEHRTMTLGRNPITDNDAYALFDARLAFGRQDEGWSIDVFAKNLTDEYFNVGGFGAPERTLPTSLDPTRAGGNYMVYPNEPRTIGVAVRARY